MVIPLEYYLVLSAILFFIGMTGVLIRRNAIIMFLCVEMMMNAVNISLVAFDKALHLMIGQTFVIFVVTVAAAEAAVGLAIIVALTRHTDSVDVEEVDTLRD
jgi:NADH-quinone oxidoreductase subunit K